MALWIGRQRLRTGLSKKETAFRQQLWPILGHFLDPGSTRRLSPVSSFFRAVEVDFRKVLQDKNAMASVKQIIIELEGTQASMWSPVILNGSGFGVLANHSLTMAAYLSRANAAISDMRDLLSRG